MQKLTQLVLVAFLCMLSIELSAQNAPIELSQEVNTTYYTDGSSKSNARLLFTVEGQMPQTLGFMGRRLKPHLNGADIVQDEFASFRQWGAASTALGITFTGTLIGAVFGEEVEAEPGQSEFAAAVGQYKWAIASGVGYLAAGFIAQQKLYATIEQHNMVLSPSFSSTGVGLQLNF